MNSASNLSAKEALRLATTILNRLSNDLEQPLRPARSGLSALPLIVIRQNAQSLAAAALEEYQSRRQREKYLPNSLLGEPAWDILLDLFVAWAKGQPSRVKSACLSSRAAETTALRYISAVEEEGLIWRRKSQDDARVTFISLTNKGVLSIGNYLAEKLGISVDRQASDLAAQAIFWPNPHEDPPKKQETIESRPLPL